MTEKTAYEEALRGPSDDELDRAMPRDAGGRELRVGLFVLLGALSFLVLLYLLTDPSTFRGRYKLTTTVETAAGLRRGDPVRMRGVNVGRVDGFRIDGSDVVITLEIEGEWDIPRDSRAQLSAPDLLGGRIVDILPGSMAESVEPGDHIPGVTAPSVLGSAGNLGDRAEDVLQRMQSVLSDPTIEGVQGSVRDLERLLADLSSLTATQSREIARLTASLNRSAEGLEAASEGGPELARAAARADSAMLLLNQTSLRLRQSSESLRTVLGRVEEGEGTLGLLTTDDALYRNLTSAAAAVEALATDIRENPRRYVNMSVF